MGRAIEAKLLITAEDKTAAAFAAIMARVDKVLERSKMIDRAMHSATRAMSSTDAAIERAGRAMVSGARDMERAAKAMSHAATAMKTGAAAEARGRALGGVPIVVPPRGPRHGHSRGETVHTAGGIPSEHSVKRAIAGGGYVLGGVGGAVAGVVAYETGKEVVTKSAERQHERIREEISGMSPGEREEAEKRAAVLSAQYPQIDQTGVMHTLRNARAVTGSYEEASHLAGDLLRTRIVAQAAKPGRDVEGDFDKLIKGMEEYGVTQDPKAFHEALGRVQKVLAVEGDTLTADSIYQSFKYTRQALPGTSQRFMLGTAPSISQAMGGSSFGTALSSFNQAIVQGRMSQRSLQLGMDLGLIDKKDVNLGKDGKAKNVKTALEGGHGFKDWQTAKTDPDKYLWNTLEPALKAKGITDPNTIMQITSTLFGNRMAGDLVGKILTQRTRIEKNQTMLASAPDDPAARIMAGDPIAAWKGVENSFSNLAAAIPVAGSGLTGALNAVANAINDRAAAMQGVKTDHARIEENRAAYNIASAQDLTKMGGSELDPLKAAALVDLRQKILAKQLEMKGVQGQIDEQAKMGLGEYLVSGRNKLDDSMLPFRMKNLQKELADLGALVSRINHLGETSPTKPATAVDTEHDRIVRAATGGATIAGPFAGQFTPAAPPSQIEVTTSGKIEVSPGSALLQLKDKIETTVTKAEGAIATMKAGMTGLRAASKSPVGTSMPEAMPGGRSGTGRQ